MATPQVNNMCEYCRRRPRPFGRVKGKRCCSWPCNFKLIFSINIQFIFNPKRTPPPPQPRPELPRPELNFSADSLPPPPEYSESVSTPGPSSQPQPCSAPECNGSATKDWKGGNNKFCKAHAPLADSLCLSCNVVETKGPFCSKQCVVTVAKKAPRLIEVPITHAVYRSVLSQFHQSWRNGQRPTVRHIYKIILPKPLYQRYTNYRASIEALRQFRTKNLPAGNEKRRWHGTYRTCNLGDNGKTKVCGNADCFLCHLITSSYDLTKAKAGSFGRGVYTSSTASMSNGYARNRGQSRTKALLLNKVVVGNDSYTPQRNQNIRGPPTGFDSVHYRSRGYDELVVYNNDAIRPSYLVIYDAV